MQKAASESAEKAAAKETEARTNLPFAQFALICTAWSAPAGRADKGYLSARRVSDTEVVLCTQDGKGHDVLHIVTIPTSVSARVRPYDLDENA